MGKLGKVAPKKKAPEEEERTPKEIEIHKLFDAGTIPTIPAGALEKRRRKYFEDQGLPVPEKVGGAVDARKVDAEAVAEGKKAKRPRVKTNLIFNDIAGEDIDIFKVEFLNVADPKIELFIQHLREKHHIDKIPPLIPLVLLHMRPWVDNVEGYSKKAQRRLPTSPIKWFRDGALNIYTNKNVKLELIKRIGFKLPDGWVVRPSTTEDKQLQFITPIRERGEDIDRDSYSLGEGGLSKKVYHSDYDGELYVNEAIKGILGGLPEAVDIKHIRDTPAGNWEVSGKLNILPNWPFMKWIHENAENAGIPVYVDPEIQPFMERASRRRPKQLPKRTQTRPKEPL